MEPGWYPIIKASHLIFMVTYFAGTFHVIRLFIQHQEALSKWEPDRTILTRQYMHMERRTWYGVTWPSFVLMFTLGLWMFWLNPALIQHPWMHAKLGLISLLFVHHFKNQTIYREARKNAIRWSPFALRIWSGGATVLLIAIVLLAVLKQLDWRYGTLGLLVLGLVLTLAVTTHRRKRARSEAEKGALPPPEDQRSV